MKEELALERGQKREDAKKISTLGLKKHFEESSIKVSASDLQSCKSGLTHPTENQMRSDEFSFDISENNLEIERF